MANYIVSSQSNCLCDVLNDICLWSASSLNTEGLARGTSIKFHLAYFKDRTDSLYPRHKPCPQHKFAKKSALMCWVSPELCGKPSLPRGNCYSYGVCEPWPFGAWQRKGSWLDRHLHLYRVRKVQRMLWVKDTLHNTIGCIIMVIPCYT